LYNWYVVAPTTGKKLIAGWHVPTGAEWYTLINYLGGVSVAGGPLKEIGFSHWVSPNYGATNSSGFTALPGGVRGNQSGDFLYQTLYGQWWSVTENTADARFAMAPLIYDNSRDNPIEMDYWYKYNGFSVRLVKD